ncbi:hypothetical protein ACFL3C_00905 [Patescibacteria group bacterium]
MSKKPDRKSNDVNDFRKEEFLSYLDETGEIPTDVIESIRKNNAIKLFEKLAKIKSGVSPEDIIDTIKTSVRLQKIFEGSHEQAAYEITNEIIQKYKELLGISGTEIEAEQKLWDDISKEPNAGDVAEMIFEFKDFIGYLPTYTQADKEFILRIAKEFDKSARSKALNQVYDIIKKGASQIGWAHLYVYIKLSDLGLKKESIEGLKIHSVSLFAIMALNNISLQDECTDEELHKLNGWFPGGRWGRDREKDIGDMDEVLKFYQNLPTNIRYHAKELRVTSWGNSRLHPHYSLYKSFKEYVEAVPDDMKDDFFNYFAPERYHGLNKEIVDKIENSTEMQNYFEYAGLVNNSNMLLSFSNFERLSGYFSAIRWKRGKKGLLFYRETPKYRELFNNPDSRIFDLFEIAGKENVASQNANKLVERFSDNSSKFVAKKVSFTSDNECEPYSRSVGNMQEIYDFTDLMERCFFNDADLMKPLLKVFYTISGVEFQAIDTYLNGSLFSDGSNKADLQIVEGAIIDLIRRIVKHKSQGGGNPIEYLAKSPREIKERCVVLSEYGFRYEILEVMKWGNTKQVLDFLNESKKHFISGAIIKMSERPECLPLYYYLDEGTGMRSIDKMNALYDAGLSSAYHLGSPEDVKQELYRDKFEANKFWMSDFDINEFVKRANKVAQIFPGICLRDVLYEQFMDYSDEELEKRAKISALLNKPVMNPWTSYYDVSEVDVDVGNANIASAEATLKRKLNVEEMQKVMYLSNEKFAKIKNSKKAIELFLQKEYFQNVLLDLDITILENPLIWKYSFPDDAYKDPGLLSKYIALAEKVYALEERGFKLNYNFKINEDLLAAYEQSPLILDDDIMDGFKHVEIYPGLPLDLASRNELDIRRISKISSYFYYSNGYEYKNIVKFVENTNHEDYEEVRELHELIGGRISIEVIGFIKVLLEQGKTAEEIKNQIDQDFGSYNDDELEDLYGVKFSAIRRSKWWQTRSRGELSSVPGSLEKTLEYGIREKAFGSSSSPEVAKEIAELDSDTLQNLELLSSLLSETTYPPCENPEHIRSLIIIAKSENFQLLIELFKHELRYFDNLIKSGTNEQVANFCKNLDEDVIAKLKKLPSYILIHDPVNAIEYLRDEQYLSVLKVAERLHGIVKKDKWGREQNFNITHLLLFDAEADLAILDEIEQSSLLPISTASLERLMVATENENYKDVISKVLATSNFSSSITLETIKPLIEKLPKKLQKLVIVKNASHFGWELIGRREELEQNYGFERSDFLEIVKRVYRNDNLPEVVDYFLIDLLIELAAKDELYSFKVELWVAKYSDDYVKLLSLLLNSGYLGRLDYANIPEDFKKEEEYWQFVAKNNRKQEHACVDFIRNFANYESYSWSLDILKILIGNYKYALALLVQSASSRKVEFPEELISDAENSLFDAANERDDAKRITSKLEDENVKLLKKRKSNERWITKAGKNTVIYEIIKGRVSSAMEVSRKVGLKTKVLTEAIEASITEGGVMNLVNNLEVVPETALRSLEKKHHLLAYRKDLNIADKEIYERYADFKKADNEVAARGFVEAIQQNIESLISNDTQPGDITEMEHYEALVNHVFQDNSGNWTNFENNESCRDRSDDLSDFKIRDVYMIDLAEGVEMQLRKGEKKDEAGLNRLQGPIARIQGRFAEVDFKQDEMRRILDEEIDKRFQGAKNKEMFNTREEKIFALLLESLTGDLDPKELKELLIAYQFAEFQGIREYLDGTRDRAEQAKNPEYAYMLELREFFADHLKEVQRKVAKDAHENEDIVKILPDYFKQLSSSDKREKSQAVLNKMRASEIGWRGALKSKVLRMLKGKGTPIGQVKLVTQEMLDHPEMYGEIELGKKERAYLGMIQGERRKAASIVKQLTGQEVDPSEINLGELNFEQYLEAQESVDKGEYDENLFYQYLTQLFQSIFEEELGFIDREVAKYQPKEEEQQGKQLRKLECFITKNHTSAHARQVGGVCVAGDNPAKLAKSEEDEPSKIECQWNMSEYFQMVLRDKETKTCQGAVLLHHYEEGGKKILTASINPSSTYLFKVNEGQLLNGLVDQLGQFAEDNNIDMILMSKNKQIRTNRTGGEFERAMNERIKDVDQDFSFDTEKAFSFSPSYSVKDCDVIWLNENKNEAV